MTRYHSARAVPPIAFVLTATLIFSFSGNCSNDSVSAQETESKSSESLKHAVGERFLIGAGVGVSELNDAHLSNLIVEQFNVVTAENCMKPTALHRSAEEYDFSQADRFVKFAMDRELTLVGHTLLWARDDQTPGWFFRDGDEEASAELLQTRLEEHIQTVASRYRGKVAMWDVVNEALSDGEEFLRPSTWQAKLGEEYLLIAFLAAHQAAPDAKLVYNDYGIASGKKKEKLIRLIKLLQKEEIPLFAVGVQGHFEMGSVPFEQLNELCGQLRELNVKLMITELDIDVIPRAKWWADGGSHREEMRTQDPYKEACPPEVLAEQAEDYRRLFEVLVRNDDVVERVTFWNLHDGSSWLNDFPWKRVNHPLLFDRNLQPKPAFEAVMKELSK